KQDIFVNRNFNFGRQIFTPATRRKELQQARVIRERRKQEENKNMSIKDLLNARLKETQTKTDSITDLPVLQDTLTITILPGTETPADSAAVSEEGLVNTDNYQFDVPAPKEPEVRTDNYRFEDEAVKDNQPSESFLSRYMKAREK